MTIRRIAALVLSVAISAGTWGCGAAPDPLADNLTSNDTNNTTDTSSNTNTGSQVVMPSPDPSVSELANSYVISAPIVGSSLAADVAGQFTTLAKSLSSPGWGVGEFSFDVVSMDWQQLTQAVLSQAAGRGGLVKAYFLPVDRRRVGPINGNLLDVTPASGMSTVGVLPIVFITTDFEGFPASGAGLEVGLWSQQAACPTCDYSAETRYQHEVTPLISSVEIRQLREQGLWNDRVVVIIAKTAVWWAASESNSSRIRNWMILQPTGGEATQVRCLTSDGVWPQ